MPGSLLARSKQDAAVLTITITGGTVTSAGHCGKDGWTTGASSAPVVLAVDSFGEAY